MGLFRTGVQIYGVRIIQLVLSLRKDALLLVSKERGTLIKIENTLGVA